MGRRDELIDSYFEWISNLVCKDLFAPGISFKKLLKHLHATRFRYVIPRDRNRAEDGENLRYRFALSVGENPADIDEITYILDRPCTVLEMMVALALRAEETMDDPNVGDRTAQWFWYMISSLGLGSMTDDTFDRIMVIDILERFMDRQYAANGKGGLFYIRRCERDLRTVEIWHQLCWYLDSIT